MDYRKKIEYQLVNIPQGFTPEDRGIDSCCCKFQVIADLTSTDSWKNDVTGVYEKKADVSDSITWEITKCGEAGTLPNLGDTAIFPNETLGVGFIFDWRQYLNAYGAGLYTIDIVFNIAGITGGYTVGQYDLSPYSTELLDGSIRVWSEFNSYFLKKDFDFTNSNFKDSIRVPGYFGFRKVNTRIDNHVDKGRRVIKSTRENLNGYEMQAEPLTECASMRLLDFHLLCEDTCYLTDHNSVNHSYRFLDTPVVVDGINDPTYLPHSRLAKVTAVFGDRTKQDKAYYNV